jgi:hypothetical protein
VQREEWKRYQVPDAFRSAVSAIVAPGTTVIVTADSLDAGSTGAAATVIEAEPDAPRPAAD